MSGVNVDLLMAYKNNKASLLNEIQNALSDILYGSVEIYVQDGKVTQITKRDINKTQFTIDRRNRGNNSFHTNGAKGGKIKIKS